MWFPTDATGSCLRTAIRGDAQYEDFGCLYPTYGKTYFNWEYPGAGFSAILDFMDANPWLPIVAVALYGLAIFLGQKYFQNRPAWDLRPALAAWNLGLAVFSLFGVIRLAPHLFHNLYHYDMKTNLCADPMSLGGTSPTTYWGLLFAWSKFFELIDTFFIVVRKKKLMFLHWYHHITVLLCCWHGTVSQTPTGFIFSVVNYSVHAVMYFYYFLMAIKCKPKWCNPVWITVAQITQMVIGVSICLQAYKYASEDESCFASILNIRGTLFMYATYLYLFCEFFFKRYVIRAKKHKAV